MEHTFYDRERSVVVPWKIGDFLFFNHCGFRCGHFSAIIVQKYNFGNGHKTYFTVNVAYISIAVNLKIFTIQLYYGDVALFLQYDWSV